MAIGNPLSLTSTVTSGIISALDRPLNLIDDSYGIENFIQTDAVINPGNSGGALVDLNGAVIGVNTAIASRTGTYIGYGFAIPINMARTVAKDLIAHGKITRGYIGVQIRNVDNAMAKALGLDKPQGVIVETIVPDGAAADTELKEGDVILKIDERKINKANQLQGYVATKLAGDVVTLTVFRDGERFTVDVELKAIDEEAEAEKVEEVVEEEEEEASVEETFDHLGMTVRNLTAKERDEYKVKNGVMITNVESFSVARRSRSLRESCRLEGGRRGGRVGRAVPRDYRGPPRRRGLAGRCGSAGHEPIRRIGDSGITRVPERGTRFRSSLERAAFFFADYSF